MALLYGSGKEKNMNPKVSCVSDYLSIINEFEITYRMYSAPGSSKFLYRGISNKSYDLIPSIFRRKMDYDITSEACYENNRYSPYFTEKQLLQAFILEAIAYIKNLPSGDLCKWVEYAQHYGVPTRLLDWTENPLVALYFACKDNKPDYNENGIGGKDAAVWMINISNYKSFASKEDKLLRSNEKTRELSAWEIVTKLYEGEKLIEYPILYRPYYTNLRMSAQSSLFMVWGQKEESFNKFFTQENWLRSNKDKSGARRHGGKQLNEIIFKFVIGTTEKQFILRELDNVGINEKTLFPGLDGIGRYIEMKYRVDPEELKDFYM
ncbi:FRG domain-containing protein [Syntrophomonas wolfei]|uniref:FRG domain-containing protein n=1 Tax=Syntrophomonas wolfei TaxID=863 RepID=UPI0023F1CFDA|nr:FRG domain-containing protein [Syntrophomonas wolfei]